MTDAIPVLWRAVPCSSQINCLFQKQRFDAELADFCGSPAAKHALLTAKTAIFPVNTLRTGIPGVRLAR